LSRQEFVSAAASVPRATAARRGVYDGRTMTWVRGIAGILCVLIGLVWIGQGTNLIPGSVMTGQMQWAIIGLAVLAVGGWLLWGLVQQRRAQ